MARATVLEGAAGWSLAEGDAETAASVLSAARTLRGVEDTNDPVLRDLLDRCRAELGEERFAAAWSRGAALSRPEELALQSSARR